MSANISTYIPTGNASGTRATEPMTFTFGALPQALTVYVKYQVRGIDNLSSRGVLGIGAASATPRLLLFMDSANQARALFQNTTTVNITTGSAIAAGNIVELRATLTTAGLLTLGVTVNGGTESTTSGSAQPLPTAWGNTTLAFGRDSANSFRNFIGMMAVCILRGVQSLDTMRRFAGTHTRNG